MIEDTTIQLLVALVVSVSFVVMFREWKPFFEVETDTVVYICGKTPTAAQYHGHHRRYHF